MPRHIRFRASDIPCKPAVFAISIAKYCTPRPGYEHWRICLPAKPRIWLSSERNEEQSGGETFLKIRVASSPPRMNGLWRLVWGSQSITQNRIA